MTPTSIFPSTSSRTYAVDMNTTDPVQLACRLHQDQPGPRPLLLIDCQHLRCLRTHGVSYLASKLLSTRAAGADVLLYNVGPVLERTLRLLRLHELFTLWQAPRPATPQPA